MGKVLEPNNFLGPYSNMKFPFLKKIKVSSATAAIAFWLGWSSVKWMNCYNNDYFGFTLHAEANYGLRVAY